MILPTRSAGLSWWNSGRYLFGDTDRSFFAPWGCLDAVEKTELAGLLTRLKEGLVKPRG